MNGSNWFAPVLLSVLVHAAILGALVCSSGGDAQPDEPETLEAPPATIVSNETKNAVAPVVPLPAAPAIVPAAQPASPAMPTAAAQPSDAGYIEYKVKPGDTLTVIARNHGCNFTEIAALNGKTVKQLSNLWAGQTIKLPKTGKDGQDK